LLEPRIPRGDLPLGKDLPPPFFAGEARIPKGEVAATGA